MKKMTKLLSVILAFVMALSCMTMMASAAKASYKTAENLTDLNAYSPYGTVTRLSTEERLSILLDSLDTLLTKVNINMGWQGLDLGLLKIQVLIDFTNVDQALKSLDSIYDKKGYLGIIGGTIGKLNIDGWTTGMSRGGTSQEAIVNEILKLLSANTALIENVFDEGINLGLLKSFIKVDLTNINNLVKDLPSAIEGIVYPLFSRQDDLEEQRKILGNKTNDSFISVVQSFVNGLFTKPMNWTSYREDAAGNDLGYTTTLPTQADGKSRYFVKDGDTIAQYDYQYAGLLGDPKEGYKTEPTVIYEKAKEYDSEDCTTYVYRAPEGYSGDQTLKWYKADNKADANGRIQSSYWLPTVKAAMEKTDDSKLTLNINGTDSLLGLLYKFAPYIFAEMAPTVLNGSVKYELAKAFGVSFEHIGSLKATDLTNKTFTADADLVAATKGIANAGDFFTKAQDFYVWEYSDYKVIDGVPYYRFQNDYYKGTLPKDLSAYYSMFKWDWNIGDDFLNEFIPTSGEIGTKWLVDSLNNLVKKAIDTVIADSWTVKGTTYTKAEVFNWVAGGNDKLLNNLMVCARNFFNIAPEEIVDEYFEEAQFYNAMMNGTMNQAVNGLVCELVKLIMPQIKFADNIIDQPITAIAAIVVRELCTQLMPKYNFDAMIYANYGVAGTPTRALKSHTADEWLNITLYMGVNLGMYYLRNIADVGEDSDLGYFTVMQNLGAIPTLTGTGTNKGDAITFGEGAYKLSDGTPSWMVAVDWIIDWALDTNAEREWCWHFGNLVNVDGEVNLATYQNPFNKIDKVLLTFFPELETLLNTSGLNGQDYGSGTWLEKILKDGLVDNIVSLNLPGLLNMLKIQDTSVLRRNNIANEAVKIVVNMLNKICYKVAGGANLINSGTINSVDTLLIQANLKTTVSALIGKLYAASSTHHIFDPILPIANFFIGWTTDPQKYTNPVSVYSNSGVGDNNAPIPDYFCTKGTETIKVMNSASGMLLKHRDTTGTLVATDSAYTITVQSIASDDGTITCSSSNVAIAPGEAKDFTLATSDNTSRLARVVITYTLIGKDGQPLGGTRTASSYIAVSNNNDPGDYAKSLYNKYLAITYINAGWSISGRDSIVITSGNPADIQEAVEGLYFNVTNWRDRTLNITKKNYTPGSENIVANTANLNAIYSVAKDGEDGCSVTCNFAKLADGVDVNTIPSGTVWSLGSFNIEVTASDRAKSKDSDSQNLGYLYYADLSELEKAYKNEVDNNRSASDYTAESFSAYVAAMKEVGAFLDGRLIRDNGPEYFAANYTTDKINAKLKAFNAAVKALKSASASGSTDNTSIINSKLESIETRPEGDHNFQDYKLFEYFKYENERTSAREMISATTAPLAPQNYIKNGVSGNELIEAIIGAQTNANVIAGINATVVPTTAPEREDELKAYSEALNNFNANKPNYSALECYDKAAKLQYYYNFMSDQPKTADLTFINKEIAYAEAQGYVETDYSADSWSRYETALANAKAITSADLPSKVFDAKYELMVAQNKLEKHSMKESGYLAEELIPLIDKANVILNNFGTSSSLYTVKADAGITDAEALGQLVSALGIEYSVEIDGKTQKGILYNNSALTFKEYDRTATAKNKKAVDMAADKLRTAIENFECTAVIESGDNVTTVDQGVRYIQGIVPNSIPTEKALLDRLTVTGGTPVVTVSKAGQFGTGTRIDLKNGEDLLATYFVVIYGDVNGDGAVDAFDALEVDYANCSAYYMGGVYDDAADLDGDGVVTDADYAALVEGVQCKGTISQVR